MYTVLSLFQLPLTVSKSTVSLELTSFLNFNADKSELLIDDEFVADVTALTAALNVTTTFGEVHAADVIDCADAV